MDVSNYQLKDAFDPRADDTELRLKVEAAITREHGELFGMYPNPSEFNDLVRIRMIKAIAMASNDKNDRLPPVGYHPTEAELNAARDMLGETATAYDDKIMTKLTGLSDADVERLRAAAKNTDLADQITAEIWLEIQKLAESQADRLTLAYSSKHGGKGDEVDAIIKQRQEQWGDAYLQIAGDWNTVLGMEVTNAEFIAMMILMKLRRWSNSDFESDDCLTDIIGYAKLGLSLSDKA